MSEFSSKLGVLDRQLSGIQSSANNFGRTSNSINRAASSLEQLTSSLIPSSLNPFETEKKTSSALHYTTKDGNPRLAKNSGAAADQIDMNILPAPVDTCIMIEPYISSTGSVRYLGRNVYETIQNMIAGKETLGHAVVVDATGRPSAAVYDKIGDGYCLKGTNVPVKIKEENGKIQGVLLSEKEYSACVTSMQTTDQSLRKFTYDSRLGSSDDANVQSWFQRNWDWLLSVAGALVAFGTSFFLSRRSKKKEKRAQQNVQNLKAEVNVLTNQILDLTEKNNALASSSQQLGSQVPDNDGTFMPAIGNSRD